MGTPSETMGMQRSSIPVTLIPGDGIGPEVASAAREVVDHLDAGITWDVQEAGAAIAKREGSPLPDRVLDSVRENRVALKGPVTTPIGKGFTSVNVRLRRALDLYASFRPVRSLAGVKTRHENVDIVIVRENTEGLYAGREHEAVPGVIESLRVITEQASNRIANAAFVYARMEGRNEICALHKAMVMPLADNLFLSCCRRAAERYPFIRYREERVDDATCGIVADPSSYDMVVVTNLYGDVLSDLCAGLVGGLGVVPGANVGDRHAVFEAVHGSAPDIAGKGIANPAALMLSAVLMLRHIGKRKPAAILDEAVRATLADPSARTGDLGGHASTKTFTGHVLHRIDEIHGRSA